MLGEYKSSTLSDRSAKPSAFPLDVVSKDRADRAAELLNEAKARGFHQNGCVFAGDSYFDARDFWTGFYDVYKGKNVFSSAIGGSCLYEWVALSKELIIPFEPKAVVFHAGTNDINLYIGEGLMSIEELKDDFVILFDQLHEAMPKCRFFFFGPEISDMFPQNASFDLNLRDFAKDYCEKHQDYMAYLDSFTDFLNKDGHPNSSLFISDGLHPSIKGYELYVSRLNGVCRMPSSGKEENN